MKIIITGATGFVGAHLTRYFAQKGHEVLALGRAPLPPKRLLDFATYRQVNWSDNMSALEGDVAIHSAALASDSAKYKDLYLANVEGTRQLIAATQRVGKFVLISSSSVYAYRDNQPKVEADAGKDFDFLTDYGKTKLLSERVLSANNPANQQRLIIRPRVVYGVGDRVILPRLLNMVKGDNFVMPGNMKVTTSQTHVEQIARLIDWFIEAPNLGVEPLTFNLSDALTYQMGVSIYDLLSALTNKQLYKKQAPIGLLKFIARTGASKKITKFLIDAVTHDCVLDLSYLSKFYTVPTALNMPTETPVLKAWIDRLGGLEKYLERQEEAPWLGV